MQFWKKLNFWKKRPAEVPPESGSCSICGRPVEVKLDPMSGDCGGDCWGCIGHIEADIGGDPEQNLSIGFVAKEISWGWREPDGTPKPQEFFLAGNHSFIRVLWRHSFPDEPVELWSELSGHREEVRKLEIWSDGRVGYASASAEIGGTQLSELPIPALDEIAVDPAFEPQEISRFAFEKKWDEKDLRQGGEAT